MSLMNKVQQIGNDAPASGFVNVNFGKLLVNVYKVTWVGGEDGAPRSKVATTYEGEELANGETLEIKFTVKISELNPQLTFEYERTVPIRASGAQKTDWSEIVLPSLQKVFGKNTWADAIEKQPYVAVESAPNVAGRASNSGKVYDVPRFISKYATLEECKAARDLRYAKKEKDVDPENPTAEIVSQAVALIQSVGAEEAEKMLEAKPFGNYDPATLFALAMTSMPDDADKKSKKK